MIATILICIVDALLINVAFLLSFLIKFGTDTPEEYLLPYKESYMLLTVVYILTMAFYRVYKNHFRSVWELFKRVTLAICLGTVLNIAMIYVFRVKWFHFTVSNFLISCGLSIFLIFLFNTAVLKLLGRIKKNIAVIGRNQLSDILQNGGAYVIHEIDHISELVNYKDIDEVIIAKNIEDDASLNLLIYLLAKLKVNVVFSPNLYSELLSKSLADERTIQFLTTFIGEKTDWEEFLIRAFDIVCSSVILVLISPLLFLIALAIKITSNGPVLYKQTRVAKDGEPFEMCKFRTMKVDAEKHTGPTLAAKDDLRTTKIGRFLRESHLDEIPQLLNVLQGKMCLVGPRPERPHFVKRHESLRGIRLAVKPGITGLAQIRSLYDLHPRHKMKYDYLYIQKRSFMFNLYILMKTVPVVLFGKSW